MGAVLLSDEIEYYATDPAIPWDQRLIDPFNKESLESARYNLRLGSEYRKQGTAFTLSDTEPWLRLKPHEMALVETLEQVRLPRFLIARWNLKVRMVYEGLLWVGALQVDPGWQGYLCCPIYNMSNHEVGLKYRNEIFAMDFVRTTQYRPDSYPYKSIPYEQKPGIGRRGTVHSYDQVGLRSAPYELLRKIERMEEDSEQFQSRFETNLGLLIGIITLVVAAGAVIIGVSLQESSNFDITQISTAGVALAVAAVALLASTAHLLTRVVGIFWFRIGRR